MATFAFTKSVNAVLFGNSTGTRFDYCLLDHPNGLRAQYQSTNSFASVGMAIPPPNVVSGSGGPIIGPNVTASTFSVGVGLNVLVDTNTFPSVAGGNIFVYVQGRDKGGVDQWTDTGVRQ